MKWLVGLILLIVLVSCTDLPSSPAPPGRVSFLGKAIGGVALANASLPAWANPLRYTDVDPLLVGEGDTLKIKVTKPQGSATDFYIFGYAYVFNKNASVWEKVFPVTSLSGNIVRDWVKDTAVFSIPISMQKFSAGNNFFVVYACSDTGTVDAYEKKVWDCNGNKWGLGAFEVKQPGFGSVLLEQDIGISKFKNSSMVVLADGPQYEAWYEDGAGKTVVRVLALTNVSQYKKLLSSNLPLLSPIWATRSSACGFAQADSKTFTWLSGSYKVTVQSFSGFFDDEKITAYAAKYPAQCRLNEELGRIAQGYFGYCGNSQIEQFEQCDLGNDSRCQGLCKPDCSCGFVGVNNTGSCGDFIIEQPNAQGVLETCEPKEQHDVITGQVVSGSVCFMRDPFSGTIAAEGHCNDQCGCVLGLASYPKCGNGNCERDESTTSCPADCPLDTTGPLMTIVQPQGTVTSPMVYALVARDLSGVKSCGAGTDGGVIEPLVLNQSQWVGAKSLLAGNHVVVFSCTDNQLNNASVLRNFTIAAQSQTTGLAGLCIDDCPNECVR